LGFGIKQLAGFPAVCDNASLENARGDQEVDNGGLFDLDTDSR
jgi:hypothetical protein